MFSIFKLQNISLQYRTFSESIFFFKQNKKKQKQAWLIFSYFLIFEARFY